MIDLEISSVRLRLFCKPDSIYPLMMERYHHYLSEGPPDFTVRIAWRRAEVGENYAVNTIDKIDGHFIQGIYLLLSPLCEGRIAPEGTDAELTLASNNPLLDVDYFLRIVLSFGLFIKGGYLFHSAGVIRENKAFLFFGKSGSGKSTVAHYSKSYPLLSDDLVGVLPGRDGVMIYSTPFWNPGWERQVKVQAPAAGMYRLVKSDKVSIAPLKESQAVSEIVSSIPVIPLSNEYCAQLLPIVQSVIAKVMVYYLYFKKDSSFWQLLIPHAGEG